MTSPIRGKLIKRANERSDEWGERVFQKLLSCHDLATEEAVYYNACMKSFDLIEKKKKKKRKTN